jgi:hypothetical protein
MFELNLNDMLNLIDLWNFFRFWWVFLLILSWSYKLSLSQNHFNNKTCSFRRLISNRAIRLINAFHVLKIDCTLIIITCNSDFSLINKWAHLCSSLYNNSWCFKVLRKITNVHIIWFDHCNVFAYCWVMFMLWFIESLIRFRRKLIKLSYICWAADVVSLWLNHSFFDLLLKYDMQYRIFSSSFSKCHEVFQKEISTSFIHSLCSFMILSWYFFRNIESLYLYKSISWWIHFILIDIMKATKCRSFWFTVNSWVIVRQLFFVVSMTCRIFIFKWITANFCFFHSSSHWRIALVNCSLRSRKSLSFASSFLNFKLRCLFSVMISCNVEASSFQLCCDRVSVLMLEYQIIIFKKSLK